MDYFCPPHIKDKFIGAHDGRLPQGAGEAHIEWINSIMPLNRGDRVEVFGGKTPDDEKWYWWQYNPNN